MISNDPFAGRDWKNRSVKLLAGKQDPCKVVVAMARSLVLEAIQTGWSGPPFDPFHLASLKGISVEPREDVLDARIIPVSGGKFQIEFNPNRPQSRIRYSIAHELAHTFFPDCSESVRHRAVHLHEDREVELLCNLAAAEMLMPIGSFLTLAQETPSMASLMNLRREYQVSTEALLLRTIKTTETACLLVSLSRLEPAAPKASPFRVDYMIRSRAFPAELASELVLPSHSAAAECTAVGFTATGEENWLPQLGRTQVEFVGVSPYTGQLYPRVMALLFVREVTAPKPTLHYLLGDATIPRGMGKRIIAHVVNDKALTWGGAFGVALRRKWPTAQSEYRAKVLDSRDSLTLGNVWESKLDESLSLVHMVAQRGYGPAPRMRVRYTALKDCLDKLARICDSEAATLHIPRIACGEGGASWPVVEELVLNSLCDRGISVTVYDLPNQAHPLTRIGVEGDLFYTRE